MSINFEEDAIESKSKEISSSGVSKLSPLVIKQVILEQQVADKKEELKALEERLKYVAEKEVPEALLELGIKQVSLADGSQVTIKDIIAGSISVENTEKCMQWLLENGHSAIIKKMVTIDFGKALLDFEEVLKDLSAYIFTTFSVAPVLTFNQGVHPQTLKAFIKNQVESNPDFPKELFSVYQGQISKVTLKD